MSPSKLFSFQNPLNLKRWRTVFLTWNQARLIGTSTFKFAPQEIILKSKHANVEKSVGVTVPEYLWSSFNSGHWKNSTAFECAVSGAKLSHTEVYRNSKSFAAALLKCGLRPRDTVGIVLPNNIHYASILLGSMEAGMIPTPLNPAYQIEEMLRQIHNSESKCVVTTSDFAPTVLKFKKSNPQLKWIIVVGEAQDGCHTYSEMIKTDPGDLTFRKGSQIDTTDEIALLPYSSGTTGLPKGVSITHSNLVTQMAQILAPNCLTIGHDERLIAVLPFFHIYGLLTYLIVGTLYGAHTVCLQKFEPATFLKVIRDHKPTILHLVTPLIAHMASSPEYGRKEFESLHTIVGGAAPIGPWLIQKVLEQAEKYIFFQEVWGLTEAGPGCTVLSPDTKNSKIGSCGRLFPSTFAKVVAIDGSGKSLGPTERGEVCIKGPQTMKGYWRNEAATKEILDSDGWLHTGDIAYYDNDEYFYIVDRLKELIKVKGLQVAPAELEELLRQHPLVAEAAVIGIPHPEYGELPRAYIVSKNEKLTADELNAFIKDKISHFKQLKGGIEFVKAVPKAPSGKILRRVLKLEYYQKNGIALP